MTIDQLNQLEALANGVYELKTAAVTNEAVAHCAGRKADFHKAANPATVKALIGAVRLLAGNYATEMGEEALDVLQEALREAGE